MARPAALKRQRELCRRIVEESHPRLIAYLNQWTEDHYGGAHVYVFDRNGRRRSSDLDHDEDA